MIPLELGLLEPLGRVVSRPWDDVFTGVKTGPRRVKADKAKSACN